MRDGLCISTSPLPIPIPELIPTLPIFLNPKQSQASKEAIGLKYQHQRQYNRSDRIVSSSSIMSQPPPDLSEKATGGILSTSFRATQAQRLSIVVPIPDQGKAEELNVQKRVTPKIMTPFEARMLQSAEVFHLSSFFHPFPCHPISSLPTGILLTTLRSVSVNQSNLICETKPGTQAPLRTRYWPGKFRCLCATGCC